MVAAIRGEYRGVYLWDGNFIKLLYNKFEASKMRNLILSAFFLN
jgi:hypothetical protein